MSYSVGSRLRIDGENYVVTGRIKYCNLNDMNATWTEYCLRSESDYREKWLSYDELYQEYSISTPSGYKVSTSGYHVVDTGIQKVIESVGQVDVDPGEQAHFTEYEDDTEEKIISVEKWADGEEYSTGYYLDIDEIELLSTSQGNTQYTGNAYSGSMSGTKKKGNVSGLVTAILVIMFALPFAMTIFNGFASADSITIKEYLEEASIYTYTTSITGEGGQKADVYKTSITIDAAVKNIINGIDGDTQDVRQNNEDGDNSVTILTDSEYCIIYTSEDSETLIQVSSREYAYRSDRDLYRGRRASSRYYRRYYYSRAYASDSSSYSSYSSPYSSYNDSIISTSDTSGYNTYSSSVRQASINSRRSSGGGLSSGK